MDRNFCNQGQFLRDFDVNATDLNFLGGDDLLSDEMVLQSFKSRRASSSDRPYTPRTPSLS